MSRPGIALAMLLLASPLAALLPAAEAQLPGSFAIPTQKEAIVGGLNLTAWVMRDTRTLTASPDLRQNPLAYLWNLNFTAGSIGIVYLRANMVENGSYLLEVTVSSPNPAVQVVELAPNQTAIQAQSGACINQASGARCTLGGNKTQADATFQFFIAGSAAPGPARLDLTAVVRTNTTPPEDRGRHTFSYDLQILDPIPSFAARAQTGDNTTVAAWTNGGLLGATTAGCLAGSAAGREDNVSAGTPAVICLVAVTQSTGHLRLTGNLSGPSWFTATEQGWTSEPFNVSSGGILAPVHGFPFLTSNPPLGPAKATLHWKVERQEGAAWAAVGEGDLEVPFTVTTQVFRPGGGVPGLNWLAHAPLLVLSVAGLGYLAYENRQPKFQARSQSLRDQQVRRKTKDDDAATAIIAQQQREDVQEQSFEKKRVILDAKRDDILKSIKVAEERHQRGEITEHVLNGIRERKERQLEQVQKEMEELR